MNKNLEKVCRFLVENKIADKDLTLDFDEGILMYKDFEWDLNSKYTEVEVKIYGDEYEELIVEDIDGYILTIFNSGTIEVVEPEFEEEDDYCYCEEFQECLNQAEEELKIVKAERDKLRQENKELLEAVDLVINDYLKDLIYLYKKG